MQDPVFTLDQVVTHLYKVSTEAEMLARYFISTADRQVSIPDVNLFLIQQKANESRRAINRMTRILQYCESHNRTHN